MIQHTVSSPDNNFPHAGSRMCLLSHTGQHWGCIQGHKHILQNKAQCTYLVELGYRKVGKLGCMTQN